MNEISDDDGTDSLGRLCDECSRIDFDEIFRFEPYPSRDWILPQPIQWEPPSTTYPMCEMFYYNESEEVRQSQRMYDYFDKRLTRWRWENWLYLWHPVLHRPVLIEQRNLHESEVEASSSLEDVSRVSWETLLEELRQCDSIHCSCLPKPAAGSHIRVVDCENECVVDLPQGAEYLTLSYVWGISTTQPEREHSLSEAPQVIRDAITVVRDLGRRYLWVDQYCIDLSNPATKQTQLDSMAEVFEGSWLTIVGLGPDDQCPLPGVSRDRSRPKSVHLGQFVACYYGPDMTTHPALTTWQRRA
jgi:hypothetical protein